MAKPKKAVAKVATLPPPIGGWNARDPLPTMPPEDAITLDNIIPGTASASLRNGAITYSTGMTGSYIESLMEWSGPSGSNKLFAAAPANIYNVSALGAVGAAVQTSLSNGRWQHTMFATSGGNYLFIVNGTDAARHYDGTSWVQPTINNVSSSALITVTAHVQRLWFIQKDKLDVWYLPVASIAGDATKLELGPFCKLGGYLLAMGSWSRDGGSGPDDMAVFVTSKGEVVVYSGFNPDSDATWQLVGIYRIPEPLGRRCLVKAGSDLAILTSAGLVPLSEVLGSSQSGASRVAFTDKIKRAFESAYASSGTNFGWQVIEYPKKRLLIINVPIQERVTQHQYVMNIDTGSWCRFTGINAGCLCVLGDNLHFGTNDGKTRKYDTEYSDLTSSAINAAYQSAYSAYGLPNNKRFTMARPLIVGPVGYTPAVEVKLDYSTAAPTLAATVVASTSNAVWDVALWDVALWGNSSQTGARWQTLNGIGQVGSVAMSLSLREAFTLNATDVMFETGGFF